MLNQGKTMSDEQGPKNTKKSWFARHPVLTGVLGFFALMVILGAAGGNQTQQQSKLAASDKPAASSAESSPQAKAAAPQVLLDLKGSGSKQTQKFTAGGDWHLEWSYDCSNFGSQGNFIVSVYNGDGSMSFQNSAVNQLGATELRGSW